MSPRSRRHGADEPLTELAKQLQRRFRVVNTEVTVAGRSLTLAHPASAEDLIDERDFERDERIPYWADLWPSAKVLAEVVARMAGAGQSLLELGCGSGLVSVAAAVAAFSVTATDYYDDALRFTRLNVLRNTGISPVTRLVDWRALPPDLGVHDVVVASDVLYERAYAELVACAMATATRPGGLALLADPGRVAVDDFLMRARELGLTIANAERVPFSDGAVRQTITVYEMRRV